MTRPIIFIFALAALAALAATSQAAADGALAVGSTADLAHDGIAVAAAINFRTPKEATEAALQSCRNFKSAPKAAATCQSVGTFKAQCYAISFDPRPGAPSVAGWAIAATKAQAEEQAMAKCKAVGARGALCKIQESKCDET